MKVVCISGKARHGKDTTAFLLRDKLIAYSNRVLIIRYADYLKFIAAMYYGGSPDSIFEKNERNRTIWQQLGTEKVRTIDENFWVDTVIRFAQVLGEDFDYLIIPDTRFKNEVNRWKEQGFDTYTVRVERPNFKSTLTEEQKNHPSETAMDDYIFDYTVINDGTVDDLEYEVLKLVKEIRNKE